MKCSAQAGSPASTLGRQSSAPERAVRFDPGQYISPFACGIGRHAKWPGIPGRLPLMLMYLGAAFASPGKRSIAPIQLQLSPHARVSLKVAQQLTYEWISLAVQAGLTTWAEQMRGDGPKSSTLQPSANSVKSLERIRSSGSARFMWLEGALNRVNLKQQNVPEPLHCVNRKTSWLAGARCEGNTDSVVKRIALTVRRWAQLQVSQRVLITKAAIWVAASLPVGVG